MTTKDFVGWALDPKRTVEEAYFAELMTEVGHDAWCRKNIKGHYGTNWELRADRHRQRRLNPAYVPELEPQEVERSAEMWPGITYLSLGNHGDRPVRDLTGLQFFTHLQKLDVQQSEVRDLAPLAGLQELVDLTVWSQVVEDLRPIAALTKLKKLGVHIHEPWPLVDGWNGLTELESLWWNGNLLVLEGLGPFPKVRVANLGASFGSLPVRDLTRLPAMPALENLTLACARRLDGIEQWSRLMQLKLTGTFRELEPLTRLPALTHLEMWCDEKLDLGVLCRVPELRWLNLTSLQPQEWFALTDAPHLHEVKTMRCEANDREVAALQEVLPEWDADFELVPPRPLPALEFAAYEDEGWKKLRMAGFAGADGGGNPAMLSSESEWVHRQLQAELDKRLGKGWGDTQFAVKLTKLEAAERLPEVVETVRRVLARCRHPYVAMLNIALKQPDLPKKPAPPESDEKRLKREMADHLEWEKRFQEEAELREREHKLRQLQQEGVKIDPEEFAPAPPPMDVEELDADNEDYDEEGEPHLLAEDYDLYGVITEQGLAVHLRDVENAERLMNRPATRM